MQNIVLRNYEDKDFNDLITIVLGTWLYDEYMPKEIANTLVSVDMLSFLSYCSYLKVAVVDDEVVGFLFGKLNENYCNNEYINRLKAAKKKLKSSLNGLLVNHFYMKMQKINAKLLKDLGYQGKPELSFFAVKKGFRGLGIGRNLFSSFEDYLRQNKQEHFYLFTDNYSDYGFYVKHGMTCGKTRVTHLPFSKEKVEFYIYYK